MYSRPCHVACSFCLAIPIPERQSFIYVENLALTIPKCNTQVLTVAIVLRVCQETQQCKTRRGVAIIANSQVQEAHGLMV